MAIDKFDLPLTKVEEQILEWVKTALDMRYQTQPEYLGPDSGPQEVLKSLLSVRARLDCTEELMSRVIRARGRVSRAMAAAKAVAEDAWDSQVKVEREKSSRHGEFEAPRERYANANLETLNQKRDLRAAERLMSSVDEAHAVIQLVYRGLDGVRQDHLAILRTMQYQSHLEQSNAGSY